MKKFADTVRRLLSIALNLFIVWAEPIALPMSWDWGKEQMFIFYTEDSNILSACICAMVAVGQLVCIFTGRELPHWLHTLKYIATSPEGRGFGCRDKFLRFCQSSPFRGSWQCRKALTERVLFILRC